VNGVLTLRNPTAGSTVINVVRETTPLRITSGSHESSIVLNTFDSRMFEFNHPDVTWTSSNPDVLTITRVYHQDWTEIVEDWQWALGTNWEFEARWAIGIRSSNVTGNTTLTGTRSNGQSVSVQVTVENRRTASFNPANYPNLVEAPVPAVPEYSPFPTTTVSTEYAEYHRMVQERIIWEQINVERIKNGLNPQSWDTALALAARNHSIDLNTNNMTGHISSDGSALNTRVVRAGFTGNAFMTTEIIAHGGATRAVSDWLNSSGHKGIMLSEFRDVMGVGISGNIVTVVMGIIDEG
jgi:uncharacterized protein YkwD